MNYSERPTAVPGVVLWERVVEPGSERSRILPDGCLDLLWDGRNLVVAGPDSTARWHCDVAGTRYAALRFSAGSGPVALGMPADELRDRTFLLDELWPSGEVRSLAERVSTDPAAALESFALQRHLSRERDTFGPRVLGMAQSGLPVTLMAERLGMSSRQLHRRCLSAFGYGPRRLSRVVRMGRSIDMAQTQHSLAQVAAGCGYVDQAHLCREVRDLAGTTPTVLFGELRGRSDVQPPALNINSCRPRMTK